jgi:hypothetical protein
VNVSPERQSFATTTGALRRRAWASAAASWWRRAGKSLPFGRARLGQVFRPPKSHRMRFANLTPVHRKSCSKAYSSTCRHCRCRRKRPKSETTFDPDRGERRTCISVALAQARRDVWPPVPGDHPPGAALAGRPPGRGSILAGGFLDGPRRPEGKERSRMASWKHAGIRRHRPRPGESQGDPAGTEGVST